MGVGGKILKFHALGGGGKMTWKRALHPSLPLKPIRCLSLLDG